MEISRRTRWRRVTTSPSKRTSTTIAALLFAALSPEALPLQAQEPQQPTTQQEGRRVHVVRVGDTLWDLASFYLTDPFLWPEIYRLNTMVVEDPHWIYPDEQLLVPGPGDIVRDVPEVEITPDQEVEVRPDLPIVEVEPQQIEQGATIFALPDRGEQATLRYQPIAAVPARTVTRGDFYRSSFLSRLDEMGPRGEIVDVGVPEGVVIGAFSSLPRYSRIYVSHLAGEPPQPGDRVMLSRIDRRVEPFGYVIRPTGIATIAAVHEDVSVAVIVEVYGTIQVGNQVTRLERYEVEAGVFAEPVATGPSGQLVEVLDEQAVLSIEDLVFIDIGRSQGLDIGDEFELYAPSRRSDSGLRLPEGHIATGRVVRLRDETATLRVVTMRHPVIFVGLPVRLVRKMPS